MIVMKFGGTSVEDARAMSNVIDIIKREQARQPIVVHLRNSRRYQYAAESSFDVAGRTAR